jgi:DNA-binding NtrC family response regulator
MHSKKEFTARLAEKKSEMKDRFDALVDHLLNAGISLDQATQILEKSMIQGALARNAGNQCAAARALEVHRNTLQRKMAEYQLAPARSRSRRKTVGRAASVRKKRPSAA